MRPVSTSMNNSGTYPRDPVHLSFFMSVATIGMWNTNKCQSVSNHNPSPPPPHPYTHRHTYVRESNAGIFLYNYFRLSLLRAQVLEKRSNPNGARKGKLRNWTIYDWNIGHFHITSYLAESCMFWWTFVYPQLYLNIISVLLGKLMGINALDGLASHPTCGNTLCASC